MIYLLKTGKATVEVLPTNCKIQALNYSHRIRQKAKEIKRKMVVNCLSLFIERNKKICFNTLSTTIKVFLLNPLNLFMGILFLLLTF